MSEYSRRSLGETIAKLFAALARSSFPALLGAPAFAQSERLPGLETSEGRLEPSGSDDTSRILRAFESAGAGRPVRFGPGKFNFSGGGEKFHGRKLVVQGVGAGNTTIALSPDAYFIDADEPIEECLIEGMKVSGGRGAFRSGWRGVNVSGKKTFRDNVFVGYSECAIQNEGSDEPYWIVDNNIFDAANSAETIGIALSRGCDSSVVTRNAFLRNRIHFKARNAGISTLLHDNEFLFFDRGEANRSRASIWLVPHDSWVNAGTGFVAAMNKFGNENQVDTDYRILFVDEDIGAASNGQTMPALFKPSEGYVDGHVFSNNKVSGGHPIPFIYTTLRNFRNQSIVSNLFDGAPPSELVRFLNCPGPDPYSQSNVVALNKFGPSYVISAPPSISAAVGLATLCDPTGYFESDPTTFHAHQGGQDATGFGLVMSSESASFAGESGSPGEIERTKDAMGRNDAYPIKSSADQSLRIESETSTLWPGEPAWIEFDLSADDATTAKHVDVHLIADREIKHWTRRVRVPRMGWRRFRFSFVFRDRPSLLCLEASAADSFVGNIFIGRVRIYHAREPVNFSGCAINDVDFARVPTSSEGLRPGAIWVDRTRDNVLKLV